MSEETAGAENVAAAELRQFVERIERLEEEKAALSDDIKDVMGEVRGVATTRPRSVHYPSAQEGR